MSKNSSKDILKLEQAFDEIERENPCLGSVVKSFKIYYIGKRVLKGMLAESSHAQIPPPDESRLGQGYPWLTEKELASFVDPWGDTVKAALEPIGQAFPNIKNDVLLFTEAVSSGGLDFTTCISYFVEGREDDLDALSGKIKIEPATLKFILSQTIKPFVETRTENLRPLISEVAWFQGYCPICGAYPELSYLKTKEGHRYLKCSLCGYDWRYDRMICPYCNQKEEHREILFVDECDHQWVELCSFCKRYVVNIDLRKKEGAMIDIAAIGMVHLDVIAQKRGFLPIANTAWNMVLPEA